MGKPTPIAEILQARLKALGVTRQIKEASVEQIWESLVGPEVAGHTHVIRTEAGRVIVAVDSAAWRQELLFRKQEIVEKIEPLWDVKEVAVEFTE